MLHQSEHFYPVTGEDVNKSAVQEGFFGLGQDVVINTNGRFDLSSRWIRGGTPLQYEKNVPLHNIFRYNVHDVSDSCEQKQMNYQAMHVLIIGNFDDGVPTIAQQNSVRAIIAEAVAKLPNLVDVLFHSDVVGTSCPGVRMVPSKLEIRKLFDGLRSINIPQSYEPPPVVTPVLYIQEATTSSVVLVWSSIPSATTYSVYRKCIGVDGDYVLIGDSASTTYTDSSISLGATYSYEVSAQIPISGAGPFSNAVEVTITPLSLPTYMYAASNNKHLYVIDISSRAAPSLVVDHDFTTQITNSSPPIRMVHDDSLIYMAVGTASSGQVYAFDWTATPGSLIYRSKFPTSTDGYGVVLAAPLLVVTQYNTGYQAWELSDPSSPTMLQQLNVGAMTGNRHPDSMIFDPDDHVLWAIYGDGNSVTDRFSSAHLDENLSIPLAATYVSPLQVAGISTAISQTRQVVQRRMPASPNILWSLTSSAGWRSYELPLTSGGSVIGTFNTSGNPASSAIGRVYIMDNRYMFICRTATTGTTYGVTVWDVQNPAIPSFVCDLGSVNSPVSDLIITYDGVTKYAYLLGTTNKNITVVDITNIASPVTVSTVNLAGLGATMSCCVASNTSSQRSGYNGYISAS
jgi:hypothetical protein